MLCWMGLLTGKFSPCTDIGCELICSSYLQYKIPKNPPSPPFSPSQLFFRSILICAVCAGMLVPVGQRGKAISLVMLGWGGAMVVGVPLSAWISGHYGWEEAFLLVAVLSLVSALWLWLKLPKDIKPPALKKSDWVALWKHPVLVRGAVVTVMYSAGQFVLFAYDALE